MLALLCLWPGGSALAENGEVTPLFQEDTPLQITISGPIRRIVREAENSMRPHRAIIMQGEESLPIMLSARGKSRRKKENCRFPPLRISFAGKPAKTSLFYRQGRIKLVTHCRESSRSEQTMLREYAAYRLYNLVTPESLKVRLAYITYADDGNEVTKRLGFFIEDADDAARRLGMKEVDTGDIPVNALNLEDAARYGVFQYLIGNTDWAMVVGPNPLDCCHNTRLLGPTKGAKDDLTPVPYDFDNSGIVDAPYAFPNSKLGTRSVKVRVYRGFCLANNLIAGEIEHLRKLRPALEAEINAIPELTQKNRTKMLRYLASGYDDIASARSVERKLLRKCR